ncbi:MAG: hypothetical protein OXC63_02535, partial [Aestuariivita sp.]|nr:hypothetical protein [Aestuariivita sp.]
PEGDLKPGDRALPGRPDEQGRGRRGCAGISREFHDPSRQGAIPEGAPGLLEDLAFGVLVGDRASGAERNRTAPRAHDGDMCGWRHPVESLFAKTREFRAITTRYDRTDGSFAAGIHLVADVVAAR